MNFYLDGDVMYKRLFDGSLLRCLNEMEAMQSLQEIFEGIYTNHANGYMIARKMQKSRYFWLTMEKDYVDYVKNVTSVRYTETR